MVNQLAKTVNDLLIGWCLCWKFVQLKGYRCVSYSKRNDQASRIRLFEQTVFFSQCQMANSLLRNSQSVRQQSSQGRQQQVR